MKVDKETLFPKGCTVNLNFIKYLWKTFRDWINDSQGQLQALNY